PRSSRRSRSGRTAAGRAPDRVAGPAAVAAAVPDPAVPDLQYPISVRHAEPLADVLARLRLVDQRDRVVLGRDEAAPVRVAQQRVAADPERPGALPGRDLRG